MTYTPISACRICHGHALETVLDLGRMKQCGVFPASVEEDLALESGPLVLVRCQDCTLVQLAGDYDLGSMFGSNYGYRSGLNASMVAHLKEKADILQRLHPVRRGGDSILDIGSNDGTFLSFFPAHAYRAGVDPTSRKFVEFYPKGVDIFPTFFNYDFVTKNDFRDRFDIITSISCFYDLPDPADFVRGIVAALKADGVWHFEQSYLPLMLKRRALDTVCHEHLEYYSLAPVIRLLERHHLRVKALEFNDVNGGSFAVTAEFGTGHCGMAEYVLEHEPSSCDLNAFDKFNQMANFAVGDLLGFLHQAKAEGRTVVGLGASTKGNCLLQYAGIGPDLIPSIEEVNPDKFGKMTPGTRIPIVAEGTTPNPDYYLVLPWHFKETFLRRKHLRKETTKYVFPLPKLEIL